MCLWFDGRIINKLEDFCASGEFTTFLGDFAQEHSAKFVDTDQEQSLECYDIFMRFKREIDGRLEQFIADSGGSLTNELIMESVERVFDDMAGRLQSLDYLMAAADY